MFLLYGSRLALRLAGMTLEIFIEPQTYGSLKMSGFSFVPKRHTE